MSPLDYLGKVEILILKGPKVNGYIDSLPLIICELGNAILIISPSRPHVKPHPAPWGMVSVFWRRMDVVGPLASWHVIQDGTRRQAMAAEMIIADNLIDVGRNVNWLGRRIY